MVRFPGGERDCSVFHNVPTVRGPSSFLLNGYREQFPGVKRPRGEANHSSPSSAAIKNEWRYTRSLLHHMPSWQAQEQLYCILSTNVVGLCLQFVTTKTRTGWCSGILFASYPVRIPVGIYCMLNENFRDFSSGHPSRYLASTTTKPRTLHSFHIPFI